MITRSNIITPKFFLVMIFVVFLICVCVFVCHFWTTAHLFVISFVCALCVHILSSDEFCLNIEWYYPMPSVKIDWFGSILNWNIHEKCQMIILLQFHYKLNFTQFHYAWNYLMCVYVFQFDENKCVQDFHHVNATIQRMPLKVRTLTEYMNCVLQNWGGMHYSFPELQATDVFFWKYDRDFP